MMSDDSVRSTRSSARKTAKINYAERDTSGTEDVTMDDDTLVDGSGTAADDSALFKTPAAPTRGTKRRQIDDLASAVSGVSISTGQSKRGRSSTTRASMSGSSSVGGSRRGRGRLSASAKIANAAAGDRGHDFDEGTLVGAVRTNNNIDEIQEKWMSEFDTNPGAAVTTLCQFVFHTTGCKANLPARIHGNTDFGALIKQMTETFGGPNTPDYPLLQSGRFKNFRVNLELFWQTLIHKCKSFILFDSQFELFIQLLIHMSDSSIRTFRHTSTFSALKICTSMVEVIVELLKNLAINEKQMDVEKTKTKRVGKSEKLKFLEEQKVELDSNFDALRKLISLIFMSIFVHRYHDTVPDIRLICITELGRWMEIHPEHYIDDSYLKYIGWNLHDKAHEVRFACVNALAVQFRREDNWPKLELFASKFKQRILTLVLDVNENVAWEGCILLCSIQHAYPEMLETSETVHVMDAVFSLSKNLAIAGASFLECKIDQEAEANGIPLTNQYFLKQVIEFLDSSKHKHASYLVDASLKIWPAMRDWKAMAEMLLAKDTFDDSRKERLLIDVLCCSVRQTATAELPPGRTNAYKAESKAKEARRIADEKEILTTDLIPSLPKLLQKYIGDREQLSQLVALPQYFTLDVYLSGRNRNHLDALWSMLADIVEKYANDEVLMQTAETVSCLFSNDSVATILDKHKTKLMDTLAAAMNKACIAYPTYASQIDEATYEERKADLDAIFRKAAAFACIADLKRHNFAEQSLQLIKHHNNLSDAVIEKIIHILNIDLLNGLQIAMAEVDKKASCDEDKLKDIIKSLKIKQDVLVTQIDKIFTQKSPGMNMAFLTIADLWIFFSNGLPPDDSDNSRLLEELILEVNPDIQRNMIDYISEFVFKRDDSDDISEADKKELIQKRRTVLAAYVKLIIFGVIKKDDAAFLNSFKQNFKENFGDILKQLDVKLNKKKH